MVTVDGQKMGKSLNNFITLKQVFTDSAQPKHERLTRKYDALAVRQFILTSHYRSTLDFSDEALFAAQSGYDRITETVKILRKRIERIESGAQTQTSTSSQKEVNDNLKNITEKFEAAMNDDLNTSVALSVIFYLVDVTRATLIDPTLDLKSLKSIDEKFSQLGGKVLGIVKDKYEEQGEGNELAFDKLVSILIEQRKAAKAKMDFVTGDMIRMNLAELNIVLEDKPGGVTTWRFK
jgi:cysteinyl-tRNA synthetase